MDNMTAEQALERKIRKLFEHPRARKPDGKTALYLTDAEIDAFSAALSALRVSNEVDHTLKTDPVPFSRSWNGEKPWEIRYNDRDFKEGQTVKLKETIYTGAEMRSLNKPLQYTGRSIVGTITCIFKGPVYGLAQDWVIFTVDPIKFERE